MHQEDYLEVSQIVETEKDNLKKQETQTKAKIKRKFNIKPIPFLKKEKEKVK